MPDDKDRKALCFCAALAWTGAAEAVLLGAYVLAVLVTLLPYSEGGAVESAIFLAAAPAVSAALAFLYGGIGALRVARGRVEEKAGVRSAWKTFTLIVLGAAVLGAFLANNVGLLGALGLYAPVPPILSAILAALAVLRGRRESKRRAPRMPSPYV